MGHLNEQLNEDTSEKMMVSNANAEPLDGEDLKILGIIHNLEKHRLRLGISKLFIISMGHQWVQYCINVDIILLIRTMQAVKVASLARAICL